MLSHHLPLVVDKALLVNRLCQFLAKVSVLEMELEFEVPVVFCEDFDKVFIRLIVGIVVLLEVELLFDP